MISWPDLKRRFSAVSPTLRLAFLASGAERVLPIYEKFWVGDFHPELLRTVELAWLAVEGSTLDPDEVERCFEVSKELADLYAEESIAVLAQAANSASWIMDMLKTGRSGRRRPCRPARLRGGADSRASRRRGPLAERHFCAVCTSRRGSLARCRRGPRGVMDGAGDTRHLPRPRRIPAKVVGGLLDREAALLSIAAGRARPTEPQAIATRLAAVGSVLKRPTSVALRQRGAALGIAIANHLACRTKPACRPKSAEFRRREARERDPLLAGGTLLTDLELRGERHPHARKVVLTRAAIVRVREATSCQELVLILTPSARIGWACGRWVNVGRPPGRGAGDNQHADDPKPPAHARHRSVLDVAPSCGRLLALQSDSARSANGSVGEVLGGECGRRMREL